MRAKFLLYFLFISVTVGVAQEPSTPDSFASDSSRGTSALPIIFDEDSPLFYTEPDTTLLGKYKDNPDFNYGKPKVEAKTPWYFLLIQKINSFLESLLGKNGKKYGIYIFFGLLLFYALFRLIGGNGSSIFGKKKRGFRIEASEIEDIHAIDYPKEIMNAIEEKAWRQAVRLYYLKTLKEMEDKGLIRWRRDKTNHDYLVEITESKLKTSFQSLTNQFDLIWYGENVLEKEGFKKVEAEFELFGKEIINVG